MLFIIYKSVFLLYNRMEYQYQKWKVFTLKRKILIIGGSYMNLQMKINLKNKDGNITPGSDYRYHPYGDSAITAISVAKLGGDCVFSTRFGNDTNGKRLYEYYKACGISHELMRKDEGAQTGMSISLYSTPCDYENFVASGASMRFTKSEIDDAFVVMPDFFLVPLEEIGYEEHTVVVKSGEKKPAEDDEPSLSKSLAMIGETEEGEKTAEEPTPEEGTTVEEPAPQPEKDDVIASETVTSYIERESLALYALQKAVERKVDLILQYTPFTAKYPLETLDNIRVLVVSDEMLYSLTGFFPNNVEKSLRALMALSQRVRAKYYVIQQEDHSVFIYDGTHYEIVTAPTPLAPNRDKEKDSGRKMHQTFTGALIAEYMESKNIVRAARFAIVTSLLTRSKFGNLEKVFSRTELEQYAAEHGIELYR